jgi:hypothetical protein
VQKPREPGTSCTFCTYCRPRAVPECERWSSSSAESRPPRSALHQGGRRNFEINPMKEDETRLGNIPRAAKCGARTRAGTPCQRLAIHGRKRCRLHGGLSPGAPRGAKNGNFRNGSGGPPPSSGTATISVGSGRERWKCAGQCVRGAGSRHWFRQQDCDLNPIASEEDMKHAVRNLKGNMYGLLECLFAGYTRQLRIDYPEQTIRNAVVFASAVEEFARFGYIELVDRRFGIPADIPEFLVRTIRRSKHHPIWIPGPSFPDDPWDLYHQMKPSMRGNDVVWRHTPPQKLNTWRRHRSIH